MKYKCLVLDHDDTIVNSTPTVNFPAFKKCLAKLRPDVNLELEEYICYNFEPGLNRYYKENNLPMPELIYGWECEPDQRKLAVLPIKQIMEKLSLEPKDLVMIDDLKPGKTMADNAGIDFIGAGWSHSIPKISSYMEKECKYYCKNVDELEKYIF